MFNVLFFRFSSASRYFRSITRSLNVPRLAWSISVSMIFSFRMALLGNTVCEHVTS